MMGVSVAAHGDASWDDGQAHFETENRIKNQVYVLLESQKPIMRILVNAYPIIYSYL